MSDAQQTSPPAPPAAPANQLDQLVAAAMRAAAVRIYGPLRPVDGDIELAIARAAIDAVCQHVRDASLYTATAREVDPRVDAAIDEYLSGPTAPLPQAAKESLFAVGAAIAELALSRAAEPTADDTITARVTDSGWSDIRHAGGR